jgi:alkane 1-monooxygenase
MKYLLAYTVPFFGIIGFYYQGIWTYLAVVYAFGFIPTAEIVLPQDNRNYNENKIDERQKNGLFDFLLYFNLPLVYGCIGYVLYIVTTKTNAFSEIVGMTLSLGIILGANGINVAHELGHRALLFEKLIAKLLLIPNHYSHFYIEHNHGHHVHVSTPNDPSTARYNQNLYSFWIQTTIGTYKKAWEIQKKLNMHENRSFWSLKNDMFWFSILHMVYFVLLLYFFGKTAFFVLFFAGIVGFLLLETINYIEHYGLIRNVLPSGRFERVTEKHSWNSNHIVGRIVLYELTRHSDHHYKSQKKYQVLECHDTAPQLPYGYPTSIIIALFPPIWFAVMNKRVPDEMKVI